MMNLKCFVYQAWYWLGIHGAITNDNAHHCDLHTCLVICVRPSQHSTVRPGKKETGDT